MWAERAASRRDMTCHQPGPRFPGIRPDTQGRSPSPHRGRCDVRDQRGWSALELVFVVMLILTIGGWSLGAAATAAADVRAISAARYLAQCVRQARVEALRRSAHVGLRFGTRDRFVTFGAFVDGNGNGLRTTDIEDGVDRPLIPEQAVSDQFRGAAIGLGMDVPGIDEGAAPMGRGSNPIRLSGGGMLLSFSPTGSSSSGTIYLESEARQFAVRVMGLTGRVRLLEYVPLARQWVER